MCFAIDQDVTLALHQNHVDKGEKIQMLLSQSGHSKNNYHSNRVLYCQGFFKENVRYPVWTFTDPISLILGTRFSLILGTR